MTTAKSVFEKYKPSVYKNKWEGELLVSEIHGGVPTNPKQVEGWLKTKFSDNDEVISEMVAETMAERGLTAEEAIELTAKEKNLVGFKRDPKFGLYIEGRQLKAALKEVSNVAWTDKKWGPTRKGTKSYIPEHLFIEEDRLYLGVHEPTDIFRSFVKTRFGSSFIAEEYVRDARIIFTMTTDLDMDAKDIGEMWVRAEMHGIGASRSQSFGRFEVVRWDKVDPLTEPTDVRIERGELDHVPPAPVAPANGHIEEALVS